MQKRNLEACFIEDFSRKLLTYNSEIHYEYEDVYEFPVVVGMADSVLIPKSTPTKLSINFISASDAEDEDYLPPTQSNENKSLTQQHRIIPLTKPTKKQQFSKALIPIHNDRTAK